MTVLYVDIEHPRTRASEGYGATHAARVEAAQTMFAAASGEPCQVMPAEEVTVEQVARLAPSAVVLSGSMTDWGEYDFSTFHGYFELIRSAPVPILGICGSHQLIGIAHGATWAPLGPLAEGEPDLDPRFAPGQRKMRGFMPVEADPGCALFRGLGEQPLFFQSHYWHLEAMPAGFAVRARASWAPIQVIERLDRPVFGVQFHPERSDAAHPDGETLIRNFFALR